MKYWILRSPFGSSNAVAISERVGRSRASSSLEVGFVLLLLILNLSLKPLEGSDLHPTTELLLVHRNNVELDANKPLEIRELQIRFRAVDLIGHTKTTVGFLEVLLSELADTESHERHGNVEGHRLLLELQVILNASVINVQRHVSPPLVAAIRNLRCEPEYFLHQNQHRVGP